MQGVLARLELKPRATRWRLAVLLLRVWLQARVDRGCQHVAVRREGPRTLWILSAWESREATARFRDRGAHGLAMRRAGRHLARLDLAYWTCAGKPTWLEAMAQMRDQCGLCAAWALPSDERQDG